MTRLLGGGHGPIPSPEMTVAAGGMINQSIVRDRYDPAHWDVCGTLCFNVQIVNSEMFRAITSRNPPLAPRTAWAYEASGLPFFKLWEEMSTISGAFQHVKSVAQISQSTKNEVNSNETDLEVVQIEEEPFYTYPLIIINPEHGTKEPFVPAKELAMYLAKYSKRIRSV